MIKKKFTIDPVGREIKFKFDKESTKDFGGMLIERKFPYMRKRNENANSQGKFADKYKTKSPFDGPPAGSGRTKGVKPNRPKRGDVRIPRQNPVKKEDK